MGLGRHEGAVRGKIRRQDRRHPKRSAFPIFSRASILFIILLLLRIWIDLKVIGTRELIQIKYETILKDLDKGAPLLVL